MPFPFQFAGHTFHSAPEFAKAVVADIDAGGGKLVPDRRPSQWVIDIAKMGDKPKTLVVALAAALLQSDRPDAVAEAARMVTQLGSRELWDLLPLALDGHDVGLLLHADRFYPDQSVEDALLAALVIVGNLAASDVRKSVMERLRRAGLPGEELAILLQYGSVEEISVWLPAILVEGVPEGSRGQLVNALAGDPGRVAAITKGLCVLPVEERRACLADAIQARPELEGDQALRDALQLPESSEPVSSSSPSGQR
jgi:hypothetical protein